MQNVCGAAVRAARPVDPMLFGSLLLDGQLAAIESAFGAYAVVEYRCSAVRTGYDGRHDGLVMGSSFIASGGRDFVFRMCHCYKLFKFNIYICCISIFSGIFLRFVAELFAQ